MSPLSVCCWHQYCGELPHTDGFPGLNAKPSHDDIGFEFSGITGDRHLVLSGVPKTPLALFLWRHLVLPVCLVGQCSTQTARCTVRRIAEMRQRGSRVTHRAEKNISEAHLLISCNIRPIPLINYTVLLLPSSHTHTRQHNYKITTHTFTHTSDWLGLPVIKAHHSLLFISLYRQDGCLCHQGKMCYCIWGSCR